MRAAATIRSWRRECAAWHRPHDFHLFADVVGCDWRRWPGRILQLARRSLEREHHVVPVHLLQHDLDRHVRQLYEVLEHDHASTQAVCAVRILIRHTLENGAVLVPTHAAENPRRAVDAPHQMVVLLAQRCASATITSSASSPGIRLRRAIRTVIAVLVSWEVLEDECRVLRPMRHKATACVCGCSSATWLRRSRWPDRDELLEQVDAPVDDGKVRSGGFRRATGRTGHEVGTGRGIMLTSCRSRTKSPITASMIAGSHFRWNPSRDRRHGHRRHQV